MTAHIGPDCRDGKHRACDGRAWDDTTDASTRCRCDCHLEGYIKRGTPLTDVRCRFGLHNRYQVKVFPMFSTLRTIYQCSRCGTTVATHDERINRD